MILEYRFTLFVILTGKLFASGEWVDMPQFSDESKIYKLSPRKHTSFYNEFANNYDGTTPSEYKTKITGDFFNGFENVNRNNSTDGVRFYNEEEEEDGKKKEKVYSAQFATIIKPRDLYEKFLPDSHDDPVNVSGEIIATINSNSKDTSSGTTDSSISDSSVTLELPDEELSVTSTTLRPMLPVIMPEESSSEKTKYHNQTIVEETKFENYLPMEMLRTVHDSLKSQPTTLSGKIQFLKQFEKDLITEIEKRLSVALAPIRQTRGTHDYYDHDEEIGFPSLEGALMSISFLTFAVYLIRLVTLLLRNPNNATTNATIFVGRNRRSTDALIDDNSEKILNYLNTFDAY